ECYIFIAFIKLNNISLYAVTFLEMCGRVSTGLGLAAGNKTFEVVRQADEHAFAGNINDFALGLSRSAVRFGEPSPGISLDLLVAEPNATIFTVDCHDNHFNLFILVNYLIRVVDLLGPAQIRYVDKAVNAGFQFNKHSKIGEVAYCSFVLGSHRIALVDIFPGIFLKLLDTERNFLFGLVYIQHYAVDNIVFTDQLRWVLNMLRPRHLRDVNESFNAFFKFDKGTVIRNGNNPTLYLNIFRILKINFIPRMRLQLLKSKRYALTFFIKIDNGHVKPLIQRNDLVGMIHTAP